MSIGTLIKTIQDIMRKDVGVDGDAQRISQIVWLLFLKIFDDKEQEWQLTIPGYKSPLQTRFRWSNWAKDAEGITGEELIDFVNNELFPSLKKLATSAGVTPHGKVVGSVFGACDAFDAGGAAWVAYHCATLEAGELTDEVRAARRDALPW